MLDQKEIYDPIKHLQSPDWNAERLNQLKTLMPDLFTNDGKLVVSRLKKADRTGKDFVYSDNFNQDKKKYWEDAEMTENGLRAV